MTKVREDLDPIKNSIIETRFNFSIFGRGPALKAHPLHDTLSLF